MGSPHRHLSATTRWIVAIVALAALVSLASPCAAQLNQPLHDDGWILAAAHSPGMHGSIWRTDLWIYVESHTGSTVTLRFCRSGEDGTQAQEFVVETVGSQRVLYIQDVVDHFLGVGDEAWLGAIHYSSSKSAQVWARVYSISADGSKSYGQLIEGIPTSDASPAPPANSSTKDYQWMYAAQATPPTGATGSTSASSTRPRSPRSTASSIYDAHRQQHADRRRDHRANR